MTARKDKRGCSDTSAADPIFGEYLSVFSRAQALADGVLVDVTQVCKTLNVAMPFKFHVAMTATAWGEFVDWDESAQNPYGKDASVAGRLDDVLFMALVAARQASPDAEEIQFNVSRLTPTTHRPVTGSLKMHCGGGDQGEPVLTLMLVGED